jgi:Flp pilus assembly protein TadG
MLRLLQTFSRDQRGVIAVTFALSAMVLVAAIGCAIDYSSAALRRTKLQKATDMAVLVAVKAAPGMTDAQLRDLATSTIRAAAEDPGATIDSLLVTNGRQGVELTTSTTYQTSILGVLGFDTVALGASSAALTTNLAHEIALVIDNSGSMLASAGGASKMTSAKEAAIKLVDAMTSTTAAAANTRFSVVPFTGAVNVGSQHETSTWMDRSGLSSIHWNSRNLDERTALAIAPVTSRFDLFTQLNTRWGGCVETRPGPLATTDDGSNAAVGDTLFVPMFAPDEPGYANDRGLYYYPNSSSGNWTPEWVYPNSYLDEDQDGGNPLCRTGKNALPESEYVARAKMLCKYKNPPRYITDNSRGPNWNCTAKPLVRLTGDKVAVNGAINAMTAFGSTNLLEGFMWGWRSLSPNTPFADGQAYGTANNRKIIILLTDGMNSWSQPHPPWTNHNLSQYSSFGYYTDNRIGTGITTPAQARAQMDAKTLEACTNAKAQGVRVYTVGFSVSTDPIDAAGLSLLQSCATNSSMAYVANNSAEIIAVFDDIARNVTSVRVAR